MARSLLCICSVLLSLLLPSVCSAAELPTEPYSYREDFELNDPVKVSSAASASNYELNYKGLTSERKVSGEKSFKLDLTFVKDATVSWRIYLPKRVPAEGRLRVTGKIYVDPQSTAKLPDAVRSAPMFNYPPSTVVDSSNGTNSAFYRPTVTGQWLAIEQDAVLNAHKVTNLSFYDWGEPNVTNVGPYMMLYFVTVVGKKGERIVLYLDDFTIEGEVPTEVAYEQEMNNRWEPIRKKIETQLQAWEKRLVNTKSALAAANATSEEAASLSVKIEESIGKIRDRGAMTTKTAQQCEADVAKLESLVPKSKPQTTAPAKQAKPAQMEGMVVTVVPPISATPVMPPGDTSNLPGKVSDKLELVATPGEYEPASFVVNALESINNLEVRVGDLKKGADVISSSNIDVKVVKRWYQAGTAWRNIQQNKEQKVLVPELLLNDDTLVKVDHNTKDNYLKLNFPNETKYVWISDPEEANKRHFGAPPESTILSLAEFPVKDSPTLLPVSISTGDNKQFWLTLHVPENVPAGDYTGSIALVSDGKQLGQLQLNVRVLPFKLADPYYTSSLYYRAMLDPKGEGSISSELKSEAQIKKELADMVAHGVNNSRVRLQTQAWDQGMDLSVLEKILQLRQAAGMGGQPLHLSYGYNLNYSTSTPDTPERLNALKYRVSEQLLPLTRKYGIPEVYIYGIDEAKGDKVTAQKGAWRAIQEAGAKTEVSGFLGQFELAGDVLDVFLLAGKLNKAEADKWHSAGHQIYSYANPQVGAENPEVYRRNYGLLLWKNGYDGACTWTYHMSFGNIWNDFDNAKWRDHNFTYPTVDGVIDTIAWEGYREGVDDVRYLTTLLQHIKKAQESGKPDARNAARNAETYLADLKENLEQRDPYSVRAEMIEYILNLSSAAI